MNEFLVAQLGADHSILSRRRQHLRSGSCSDPAVGDKHQTPETAQRHVSGLAGRTNVSDSCASDLRIRPVAFAGDLGNPAGPSLRYGRRIWG